MNPAKIHPTLQKELDELGVASAERGGVQLLPIIVQYNPNTAHPTAIGSPHQIFDLLPATAQAATQAEIEALSERPDVQMIWLDGKVHTCLDQSVPLIGANKVWDSRFTGRGIKVAVVDTGIDTTHPDFGSGRITALKDFTASPSGITDHVGHGTHVASIIGGAGSRYRGVAWECLLLIAKVLGDDGGGSMSGVMAGIDWAVIQGAKVINLSLGADENGDGTDALSAMCDAAVDRGVCVCVANGNAGPGQATVGSPACARKVISIGATDKSDHIASFSSRGPTADGRTKPDLCFPGVNIAAAQAHGTQMGAVVAPGYVSASGTSMATPHCAGTAALLLQACPTLTPAMIKEILCKTAKDLGQAPNTQGYGRAQDYFAYQAVVGPAPAPTPTPTPSGRLTDIQIAQLLVSAKYADPVTGVAVVLAESGGDTNARNSAGNTPPSTDRGLWQINSYWHRPQPDGSGCSDACAYDPVCSTNYAYKISSGGRNYSAWTTYKVGAHRKFLARAQSAVNAVTVPAPAPVPGAPAGLWDAVTADLPNRVLLSIYTDGALWKEGQRLGFGPARSGEIDLSLAGFTYAYQVFNSGVTACRRPDYATIWSYRFAPASTDGVESLWMGVLRGLARLWRR